MAREGAGAGSRTAGFLRLVCAAALVEGPVAGVALVVLAVLLVVLHGAWWAAAFALCGGMVLGAVLHFLGLTTGLEADRSGAAASGVATGRAIGRCAGVLLGGTAVVLPPATTTAAFVLAVQGRPGTATGTALAGLAVAPVLLLATTAALHRPPAPRS